MQQEVIDVCNNTASRRPRDLDALLDHLSHEATRYVLIKGLLHLM